MRLRQGGYGWSRPLQLFHWPVFLFRKPHSTRPWIPLGLPCWFMRTKKVWPLAAISFAHTDLWDSFPSNFFLPFHRPCGPCSKSFSARALPRGFVFSHGG